MSGSPITQVQQGSPITQVERDESGFNSPRKVTATDEKNAELARKKQQKRPPLWRRIFCCVSSTPDNDPGLDPPDVPPQEQALLPPRDASDANKVCLVLDLDETLVHSSFKPVGNADFVIPVEIDEQVHQVYVLKRPGVDEFMKRMGPMFEVVIFTASLAKYADPVLDLLDKHQVVKHRLFREACSHHRGNYVKDMSRLGRPLKEIIIIDNSPASYLFHPENALPCESWFDDPKDTELLEMIPILEELSRCNDVIRGLANLSNQKFASRINQNLQGV